MRRIQVPARRRDAVRANAPRRAPRHPPRTIADASKRRSSSDGAAPRAPYPRELARSRSPPPRAELHDVGGQRGRRPEEAPDRLVRHACGLEVSGRRAGSDGEGEGLEELRARRRRPRGRCGVHHHGAGVCSRRRCAESSAQFFGRRSRRGVHHHDGGNRRVHLDGWTRGCVAFITTRVVGGRSRGRTILVQLLDRRSSIARGARRRKRRGEGGTGRRSCAVRTVVRNGLVRRLADVDRRIGPLDCPRIFVARRPRWFQVPPSAQGAAKIRRRERARPRRGCSLHRAAPRTRPSGARAHDRARTGRTRRPPAGRGRATSGRARRARCAASLP